MLARKRRVRNWFPVLNSSAFWGALFILLGAQSQSYGFPFCITRSKIISIVCCSFSRELNRLEFIYLYFVLVV